LTDTSLCIYTVISVWWTDQNHGNFFRGGVTRTVTKSGTSLC